MFNSQLKNVLLQGSTVIKVRGGVSSSVMLAMPSLDHAFLGLGEGVALTEAFSTAPPSLFAVVGTDSARRQL